MDTKRLLTSMLFAAGLMVIFFWFTRGWGSTPAAIPTSETFELLVKSPPAAEPGATPNTVTLGNALATPVKRAEAPNIEPTNVELTIDPATAGINQVRLNINKAAATYKRTDPLTLTLDPSPDIAAKPFSTLGLHVLVGGKEMEFPWLTYPSALWRNNAKERADKANEKFKKEFASLTDGEKEQIYADLDAAVHNNYANWMFPMPKAEDPAKQIRREYKGLTAEQQTAVLAAIRKKEIETQNNTAILGAQFLWKASQPTPNDVTLLMTVTTADKKPVAEITKNFHLIPGSYEVIISHTIRNLLPPRTITRPAADKAIDLGEKEVSRVLVKVGNTLKSPDKDYTLDAPAGKTATVNITPADKGGTIAPADTVDISFSTPADALSVKIDQFGPTNLKRDDPQGDDRFYHSLKLEKNAVDSEHGFDLIQTGIRKAANSTGTVLVGGPTGQFSDFTTSPQLWVASSNRFFTLIVRPLPESTDLSGLPPMPEAAPAIATAPATTTAPSTAPAPTDGWTRPATSPIHKLDRGNTIDEPHHLAAANIDLMKVGLKDADDISILRLSGNTVTIPAGASVTEPLWVYMGPKDRDTLKGDFAAAPGTPKYNFAVYYFIRLIQFQQGCYSFCIKDFVVMPILNTLDFLKGTIAFGNYGIAIMILVVVVRALLHPLTRASQINMAKMGKQMRDVAPKIDAMKKRYADDKKKQGEETMRIYRENKINPAGGIMGCLPMLIQMPIWAALYAGLRNDIDLRHAAFIPGWINDLASPDTILPTTIPVLGHPLFSIPLMGDIYGLNLLPILLAGVFFFQMKVTTASQPKPADEQQAQMQKMSQYMIFLFPLFLYNAPSGLNLYIFASTMAGLLDTWLVRKTLKKQGILPSSAPALPTHEPK